METLVRGVFRDETWMAKIGIGGIVAAGSLVAILYNFVFLPVFAALLAVLIGYYLRCIRTKIADPAAKLPEWNEWGDLFMSGITWLALQTGAWGLVLTLNFILLVFASTFALAEKSSALSQIWTIGACVISILSCTLMAFVSSYLMVNFAVEENIKAGFAYIKVIRSIIANPLALLSGFILASGMQSLSVIVPCATIIGIFLIPSFYFIGQVLSSLILALHWSQVNQSEKSD